jgi:hypothetical protein
VPVKDIACRENFPVLHTLVNDVAQELGGQPITHIIVNDDFNAAYGVVGWRRVPVLWIGLPLWMALRPQERLALLGHEIAHGVNRDGTRSFIVRSALSALDEWIGVLGAFGRVGFAPTGKRRLVTAHANCRHPPPRLRGLQRERLRDHAQAGTHG